MTEKKRLKLAAQSKSMDDPPVIREKLGPFVENYIAAAMDEQDPRWDKEGTLNLRFNKYHISERTIKQMVRDCIAFYWRHRVVIEEIIAGSEYNDTDFGWNFWKARNGYPNIFEQNAHSSWDPAWEILWNGSRGFGKFELTINNGEVDACNLSGWYHEGGRI
jgi:hypothetical protein